MSIWILRSRPDEPPRAAETREVKYESASCPANCGHRRTGRRLTPLAVEVAGHEVQDFVWTWRGECLLSQRACQLLATNGFTGFELHPARARFKEPAHQETPALAELILTGWAGVAPAESGIRPIKSCSVCGYQHYSGCTTPGKLFVPSQWDGTDFFMIWPIPRSIFMTDRACELIRGAHLTGHEIAPIEEFNRDKTQMLIESGFSPGPLSRWMPEARARKLGELIGLL